jgi:hypothetical protein
VTTRGRTRAALLAVLGRPSWWILGLAGFLVRGGIVLFALAVISLPSPLALANLFGPIVTPIYLGRVEPATVALIVSAVGLLVAWLLCGSWIAAATEVVLVRDARHAAIEEGLPAGPDRSAGRLLISRSVAAHLLTLAPLAGVVAIGSVQIGSVAYRELVNPSDAGPIVLRVIAGAVGPVVAIGIAWFVGEVVGGLAVRRIVLGGESVSRAVTRSAGDLLRRPLGALVAPAVTFAILVVDLAAVLAVVVLVWTEVRTRLDRPLDEPLATGLAIATLGAAWCLALLVTGLIVAWRSAAMTFEAEAAAARGGDPGRSVPAAGEGSGSGPDAGTFGASDARRPGDWSAGEEGGSL